MLGVAARGQTMVHSRLRRSPYALAGDVAHEEAALSATAAQLAAFVDMACVAIQREYPVALVAVLERAEDLGTPRELTPAFHGSFDWHSAVHGHWTLARGARLHPDADWAKAARAALERSLTAENLARELSFVAKRPGFERPYGLAWLLQLAAELRGWDHAPARRWSEALIPLEELAAKRLIDWAQRLPWPVRSGEHGQSAFALGLAFDWARDAGRDAYRERLALECARLYRGDTGAPVAYEPSAHDFLSPALAEADLMRRVLPREAFANWIYNFLPDPREETLARWLTPVASPDRADGKFAHLDGLNLSRAWMVDGILSELSETHELYSVLERASAMHAAAGLEGAMTQDWMGTHWLGSFAVYLLTRRGVR
jgi:hypothetical protein